MEGTVKVPVTAVNPGKESNTKAKTVTFSLTTIKGLSKVENEDWISGGTDEEK
ncbi:baseplate J/gp47 family protein [Mediterraneibacter gnavus]|uniref:baseplate J/gp47 family protein n=1 Tax=Mediterraneibacter gnavus TaxID=33038 RepID=UPI0036D3C67B